MTVNHYKEIQNKIDEVAIRSGRDRSELTLVAVSKGRSMEDISSVFDAGCFDFGENKVQEVLEKQPQAPRQIQWHFLGTLQKNKVRKVIGKFHLIHSVDSVELAEKISVCSLERGLVTSILLQVNISGEKTKHGFSVAELTESIASLVEKKGLNIKGFMTMAPFAAEEAVIRKCFTDLRKTRDHLQSLVGARASFKELSMGMSHDFALAIEEGATLLRIGTAIFA